MLLLSGKQSDAAWKDIAGEPPCRGLRKRLHSYQWQLQPLWQIPWDEVHTHRSGHRGQDIWIPAGEVESHQTGYVRASQAWCDLSSLCHIPDYLVCVPFRGEKNFHIFYYIYAGLYHQKKLKTYRLPDRTPPRLARQFTAFLPSFPSHHGNLHWLSQCASRRYIDSQHRRVMQDIVSSKLYKEQFDAIQECFRNIGFTEEVLRYSIRQSTVFVYRSNGMIFVIFASFLGGQLCVQNSLSHFEHRQYWICCHHIPTPDW